MSAADAIVKSAGRSPRSRRPLAPLPLGGRGPFPSPRRAPLDAGAGRADRGPRTPGGGSFGVQLDRRARAAKAGSGKGVRSIPETPLQKNGSPVAKVPKSTGRPEWSLGG